ncbi:hypothetical protein Poli38472_002938 [Pythium oligandrum]|uniref:4-coumarate--CoA ligase n=1 Tax=Pythium oligandrum TaxID=41045 RepID=A0A8K1FFP4_PYTOL|nr:hypothetical protein Poli38472_002938 [Pythium oligandrum]|eukprot:TMW57013.1 hypothetical protein Poli38472_002938 [Pythium oligandrum]
MLLQRTFSFARTKRVLHTSLRTASAARISTNIIYKSPHQELHIPDKTFWDIFTEQPDDYNDRDALICGLTHEKVTFQELHDDAQRVAVALVRDGVKQGDVTLTSLGAVCSTASPMFNAQELAAQAQLANAKFIITNRALEKVAIEAAELSGIDKSNIYTVGASAEPKKLKCINEVSKRDFESFSFEKIDPEANLLLPFSSGTTGTPKGVALSARNMVANTLQVTHIEDFEGRMVSVLPFFHIYAMLLMHVALYEGVAQVMLPRFEPQTFLEALSRYKIKKANIAPPIAIFLARHALIERYDLSATKFLVSGGAPMGRDVEALVTKRLNIAVKQAYGMTEASPLVNYTEGDLCRPGSVGRIVPNTELRVKCTLTDKDLQPNQHGELLYRGPQVMIGYLNNEEANKKTLTEDRFLRTGDIGYIDNDGFVHIVDRVKELIKYKGHQVAPAELEDILNHHPGISDACAVRGYDADGQEIPKAYVVLKDPSSGLTPEAVMEFVAERVAPYKKVREVEFIDAIPKSPTGKILRRQLQELENQRHE